MQTRKEPLLEREAERSVLSDLREGRSVLLVGPRRAGKTTLLQKTLHALREEGHRVIALDARAAPTPDALYSAIVEQILEEEDPRAAAGYQPALELSGRLAALVALYERVRSGRAKEQRLLRALYALTEDLEKGTWRGLPPKAPGGAASEVLRLRGRDREGTLARIKGLLDELSAVPREERFEALLGKGPLRERVLPLLRFRAGFLPPGELFEHLVQALVERSSARRFLLLDEVQALEEDGAGLLLRVLRARADRVSFLACADGLGSGLAAFLQEIGPTPRHPFLPLHEGSPIVVRYLRPLSLEETRQLVERSLGKKLTEEALERIQQFTGGLPGYVRLLAERLPSGAGREIPPSVVETAFAELLHAKNPDFAALWEGFSPRERARLREIVLGDSPLLHPTAGCEGEAAQSQTEALERLAERFLIERAPDGSWRITDRVFGTWLARLLQAEDGDGDGPG